MIYKSSLDDVLANHALPEFIICITDLSKNNYFAKTRYASSLRQIVCSPWK